MQMEAGHIDEYNSMYVYSTSPYFQKTLYFWNYVRGCGIVFYGSIYILESCMKYQWKELKKDGSSQTEYLKSPKLTYDVLEIMWLFVDTSFQLWRLNENTVWM